MPHTSWLDFFLGLLVRSISNEQINFLGKKELFSPLTAWFFRGLGGAPIDRSGKQGSVEAITTIFNAHDKFRIALAPEGTRKKVKKLRTGYYHIAKNLKIPIVPVAFDYKNKNISKNKILIAVTEKRNKDQIDKLVDIFRKHK